MCLTLKRGESLKRPHIATKPIKVYKHLTKRWYFDNLGRWRQGKNLGSPTYSFTWKPRTKYKLKHPERFGKLREFDTSKRYVHEGFHAYVIPNPRYGYTELYRMTIPKGAKYYLGTDNHIVTDTIYSGSLRKVDKNGKTIPKRKKAAGVTK